MITFCHSDLDGRCAGAIIHKKYPDCRFQEVNYEVPFPVDMIEQDEPVFLVDFTPNNKKDFDAILERCEGQIVWLDHHWSNISKYPELNEKLDGIRVEAKPSGAMLAWQYLFKDEPPPLAVFLTSDFDTWTHSDKRSEQFNAGITIVDHSPTATIWQSLLHHTDLGTVFNDKTAGQVIDSLVYHGQTILSYRQVTAKENLMRFGYETEFEGLKAIACCNDEKGSRFFEVDGILDRYDVAISYCHNGKEFVFGLYSKKSEVDCAALAKKHGGGGHRGASGFSDKELPFKMGTPLRETISD